MNDMSKLDPEQVDLADLAHRLVARLGNSRLEGFVMGRTKLRDAAALMLACSDIEAEQIIDTMIIRGFLRYSGHAARGRQGSWILRIDP